MSLFVVTEKASGSEVTRYVAIAATESVGYSFADFDHAETPDAPEQPVVVDPALWRIDVGSFFDRFGDAQLQITSEEELEEMRGYFELLKARSAPPSPALAQDVEQDFQPEQEEIPLPKIIMRKRIQMVAPSGAVYSGTIQDEPMDEGMQQ